MNPNGPNLSENPASVMSKGPQLAHLVSDLLSPPVVNAIILLGVAIHSAANWIRGLELGLISIVFVSAIPMVFIALGVRRQHLTDRYVHRREQRLLPFAVTLGSVVVGFLILVALHAPRELTVMVGAMAIGLLITLLITLVWKISVHAAVAATAVAIFTIMYGPLLLILTPLVALVGWARVVRGSHTAGQVIGGIILGSTVTPLIFAILR